MYNFVNLEYYNAFTVPKGYSYECLISPGLVSQSQILHVADDLAVMHTLRKLNKKNYIKSGYSQRLRIVLL